MEEPEQAQGGIAATARVSYQGVDGDCTTDLTFLSFDDLVKRDGARAFAHRLWVYLVSFLDYVVSGTLFRFFQTNWRFALYFLYPAVALTAFAGVGYLVYRLVSVIGCRGSQHRAPLFRLPPHGPLVVQPRAFALPQAGHGSAYRCLVTADRDPGEGRAL
jgi:hypothetical protein